MRKTLLILSIGFVGLLGVGVVAFIWPERDTKQPAAADVVAPGGLAEPSDKPIVSQQGEQRRGVDQLTPAEQARARAMVLSDPRVVQHTQNVRHEVLLVERHQEEKDNLGARRADVFVYVYPSNRLLYGIANLQSNVLDYLEETQEAQPILITAEESSLALNIALADDKAGRLIREQYEQMKGTPLVRPDQLRAGSAVYTAAEHQTFAPTARVCRIQRCAELLLFVPDSNMLGVMPIVNLSTEQVVYLGQ